jgi:hypothetical protein
VLGGVVTEVRSERAADLRGLAQDAKCELFHFAVAENFDVSIREGC